jgi:hypothetical protein
MKSEEAVDTLLALNGKAREIGDFMLEWYHEHPHAHETAWFKGYIIGCATHGVITEGEQDKLEDILKNLAA